VLRGEAELHDDYVVRWFGSFSYLSHDEAFAACEAGRVRRVNERDNCPDFAARLALRQKVLARAPAPAKPPPSPFAELLGRRTLISTDDAMSVCLSHIDQVESRADLEGLGSDDICESVAKSAVEIQRALFRGPADRSLAPTVARDLGADPRQTPGSATSETWPRFGYGGSMRYPPATVPADYGPEVSKVIGWLQVIQMKQGIELPSYSPQPPYASAQSAEAGAGYLFQATNAWIDGAVGGHTAEASYMATALLNANFAQLYLGQGDIAKARASAHEALNWLQRFNALYDHH
jgi:hypothetical protein